MSSATTFDEDGHHCNSCGCIARISIAKPRFCPQCGVPYEQTSNADPDGLLKTVRKQLNLGATEISIQADSHLIIRLEGRLRRVGKSTASNEIDSLFETISKPQHQKELMNAGSTEFKYEFDDMLFARVSVFKKNGQKVIKLHRKFDTTLANDSAG